MKAEGQCLGERDGWSLCQVTLPQGAAAPAFTWRVEVEPLLPSHPINHQLDTEEIMKIKGDPNQPPGP